MSTGYALFSKEITVGGNVTAKGSFNMNLICTKSIKSELLSAIAANEGVTLAEVTQLYNNMQKGYTTDTCTVSGTNVTINTDLKYPGAARYYTLEVKNSGDIPAKWNYNTGFVNNMTICDNTSGCEQTNSNEKGYAYNLETLAYYGPAIAFYAFKDTTGTITVLNDATEDYVDYADSDGNIFIEPNETMYFLILNQWNSLLSSEYYNYANGNYQSYTLDYDFTFEQATE